MTKVIDFDAFRAERKREPVVLRIGGVDYILASSMPASVAVDVIRLRRDIGEDEDVPLEVLDEMGRAVFGETVWRDLLADHRLEVDELGDLLQMVLAAYTPAKPETPEDPQAASTQETGTSSSGS